MKKTSRQIILEAVQDLHAMEQIVTRETLFAHLGMKLTTIDDRLGNLVDDGEILRVQRGVYIPAKQHHQTRPISKTILPDGTVKIEIGDQIIELSPRESRMLGDLMAGAAMQHAQVEAGHSMAVSVANLHRELIEMRAKLTQK